MKLSVLNLAAAMVLAMAAGCTANVENPTVDQTGRTGDTTCVENCDNAKTTCVAKCTDDTCKASCETTHSSCSSQCVTVVVKDGG